MKVSLEEYLDMKNTLNDKITKLEAEKRKLTNEVNTLEIIISELRNIDDFIYTGYEN